MIQYVDPDHRYMVYAFKPGTTVYKQGYKQQLLTILVKEVLNYYQPQRESQKWGWVDDPSHTWKEFLFENVKDSRKTIQSILSHEEHQLVWTLVEEEQEQFGSVPYLLQGDCGVHNFVMNEG